MVQLHEMTPEQWVCHWCHHCTTDLTQEDERACEVGSCISCDMAYEAIAMARREAVRKPTSATSFYILSPSDVGQPAIRAWGRFWPVSDFLGRILPGDVGKRVYVHRATGLAPALQVENEEQRARRAQREAHA